ncbi:hypothetical protein BRADI_1g33505v3 [Brachypodium distachyon]|uniref:Uncharacterized protein n=1 Tax=Brachypodium distachyon TaxID=15368 RepID=A0A2K2DMJ5_BRADI|nr:hypothetical protein BRADI_1g33505v3 [Brachypodium distachyon]
MGRPCPTPAFPLSLASRPWGREIKQPLPPRGATSGGARRAVSHREGVTANDNKTNRDYQLHHWVNPS